MTFNINNAALSDSVSFVNTIFNDYYPGGQSPVKNTSGSLSTPMLGRTLKSSTISGMISGDEFFRSPKYALKSLQNTISSSLNTVITGGASVADESFTDATDDKPSTAVYNPESQGESKQSLTLTKSAAYNRIMAESVSGKNLGSTFVQDSLNNIKQIEIDTYSMGTNVDTGTGNHTSSEAQSAGRRDVAYISDLTEEEKGWYQQRLQLLKSKYTPLIEDPATMSGFSFDLPNDWSEKGYTVYAGTNSYFPQAAASDNELLVSNSTIQQGPVTAYISASLIELLLLLHEKNYYISGGFGAGRDATKSIKEENLPKIWVSDHTYGRAIDIFNVGKLNGDIISLGSVPAKNIYNQAVQVLLEALAEVPQYLQPDLIVVSSDLKQEYGITEGNEPETAQIKLNKPYLRYVNFYADSNHRNHIHLSFGPLRAGKYVGPDGQMVIEGTQNLPAPGDTVPGSGGDTGSVGGSLPGQTSNNITKNYYGQWEAKITPLEFFDALRSTSMSDEAAAIFTAIIARESGGSPTSCNPNALTGDFMSLGMFQINMGVGGYRKYKNGNVETGPDKGSAHGKKIYELSENGKKEQLQGWQIAVKNWTSVYPNEVKPTIDNYNRIITEKYELEVYLGGSHNAAVTKMRELVDHRFWIPLNQTWALYTFFTGAPPAYGAPKLGATSSTGYLFAGWGDYSGKGPYGWISGTKFLNSVAVYVTTGKSEENLKQWVRDVYKNDPAVSSNKYSYSKDYIERWLNGEYFVNP